MIFFFDKFYFVNIIKTTKHNCRQRNCFDLPDLISAVKCMEARSYKFNKTQVYKYDFFLFGYRFLLAMLSTIM